MGTGSVALLLLRLFGVADGACPHFRTVNAASPWKKGTGTSRLLFSPQFQPISARSQSPFSTTRLQFENLTMAYDDTLIAVTAPAEEKTMTHCGTNRCMSTVLALVFVLIGGVSLLAQDEPARPPQSLEEKMRQFQPHAEKWQRVSGIMKDFQPLVEQGQFARAEALLDRALGILEAGPGNPRNIKHLDRFRRKADETQYLILPRSALAVDLHIAVTIIRPDHMNGLGPARRPRQRARARCLQSMMPVRILT